MLCTEPRTLSLTGFEPARKGWQGGPVSTAATQSHQHPSHFRLSPYMNPTGLPIFSWPRPVPTHTDSSTRYSPSDGPASSLRPVRAPTHTGSVHTPGIYPAPLRGSRRWNQLLSTEPRTLSLTGFEPARKGWQGGPVSTAATQSHQHPSHFRLSPYMNPTHYNL